MASEEPINNRRPMSGLRRPTTSTSSNINDMKSTFSGSTCSHGPRFKRFHAQSSGLKEVTEENISILKKQPLLMKVTFPLCNQGEQLLTQVQQEELWERLSGRDGWNVPEICLFRSLRSQETSSSVEVRLVVQSFASQLANSIQH